MRLNRTNATETIGTMTMATKNSVRRVRKDKVCLSSVNARSTPTLGAPGRSY